MVLRTALGALVTVAVLGAVAAALPEKRATKAAKPPAPYGALTPPQDPPAERQPAEVKVASNATGGDPPKPEIAPKPEPAQAPPSPPIALAGPNPDAAQIFAPPVRVIPVTLPARTVATAEPAPAPQPSVPKAAPDVAAPRQPEVPGPQKVVAPVPHASGTLNINTASIEQLDHMPGAGRIGVAIARRRPYRSVEDLLAKRVLREAVFRHIRPLISVD